MSALDDLTAQVAANTTAISSALALIKGFSAQLAAAGTDPAKLAALQASLKASDDALAAAVAANLPAGPAPVGGPAPVAGPVPVGGPAPVPGPAIVVTVSPKAASVKAAGSQQFTATLTGDPAGAGVVWSVDRMAVIDVNGRLTLTPFAGVGTVINVKATSKTDPTKSDTAVVTVG
jgi:hypothetical protein